MEDPFDWSVLRPTSPKNIKWVYFPPLETWIAKEDQEWENSASEFFFPHGNNTSTCMLCWPITPLIQQYEQSRIAMWNVAIVIYVFIIIGTKVKCKTVAKSFWHFPVDLHSPISLLTALFNKKYKKKTITALFSCGHINPQEPLNNPFESCLYNALNPIVQWHSVSKHETINTFSSSCSQYFIFTNCRNRCDLPI